MAVQDGAEGQPVAERGGHVGDADISVALALLLAPQLQVLDGGHGAAPGRAACGSRGRVADGGRRRRGKGAGGGGPGSAARRAPSAGSIRFLWYLQFWQKSVFNLAVHIKIRTV